MNKTAVDVSTSPIAGWKTGKKTLIGERIPKLDAPEKVAGLTRYLEDIKLPRMLHGKILFSDRPHARIVGIDATAARAMPGVRAVLTAADIELVPFGFGRDNTALKTGKVTCIRDEIAAVAADTPEIAAAAIQRIKVTYEDLPVVTSLEEALAEGAPVIHEQTPHNVPFRFDYLHGDIEQGIRESDVIVEDTYTMQRAAHCCLGRAGIIAQFEADGRLTLHSLTQVPFSYKHDLSRIVGVPPEKIRVLQPPIGGAFGSKLDIHPFEPICVFLARTTGRPVRIVFTREEEFRTTPTRQPMVIHLKSGARKDGTFTFRDVRMTLDNGGRTSWGATTPWISMRTISSLYRVPHVRQHVDVVYTNNIYACAFRGYGNPQATFALESQIDQLADQLGMDPLEIRLRNAQEPGETTGQGMVLGTCGLADCLKTATRNAGWDVKHSPLRKTPVRDSNRVPARTGRVRGMGMASLFHVGGGAKIQRSDGCGTMLQIDDFGGVTVQTGASEIGQGSETVIAQIVAEELGLPLSNIRVLNSDSDLKPWDVGVHASRTTFIAGNSALRAAREARRKLLDAAGRLLKRNSDELDLADGHVTDRATGEPLESVGKILRSMHFGGKHEMIMTSHFYEPPSEMPDPDHKGDVSACYAFGTQVAEVEVDLDTGVVSVLGISAAHDVGRVINRLGIEGQIEGGIAQGIGYALYEEIKVRGGRVLNPTFTDYKLVTTQEVPELKIEFIETHDPAGPHGAKGVAEAPLVPVAPAIANAIFNATGVRITELPMTPERVLTRLREARKAAGDKIHG
jgi:xanthine dehydrogenase molybdenum-binding subunit